MRLLSGVHDVEGLELAAVMGPVTMGVTGQTCTRDLDRPVDRRLADGGLARLTGVGAHARHHADRTESPDEVAVAEGRGLVGVPPIRSGVRQIQVPREGKPTQARTVIAHRRLHAPGGDRDPVDPLVGHGSLHRSTDPLVVGQDQGPPRRRAQ